MLWLGLAPMEKSTSTAIRPRHHGVIQLGLNDYISSSAPLDWKKRGPRTDLSISQQGPITLIDD